MKFNRELIDKARRYFAAVYVDRNAGPLISGSLTGYTGDRVRIYATTWYYEEPDIIRTNKELLEYIKDAQALIDEEPAE